MANTEAKTDTAIATTNEVVQEPTVTVTEADTCLRMLWKTKAPRKRARDAPATIPWAAIQSDSDETATEDEGDEETGVATEE